MCTRIFSYFFHIVYVQLRLSIITSYLKKKKNFYPYLCLKFIFLSKNMEKDRRILCLDPPKKSPSYVPGSPTVRDTALGAERSIKHSCLCTYAVSSMTVDRMKSVDLSLCMMWQSSEPGDPPSSSSSC